MRVVHSHLGEGSVGRTSEGVWEDEVYRVTPAVGTIPSASQTVVGRHEMGKVKSQRYWRMSKGESRSAGRFVTWAARRALNREKSMEDGRWGLEPPKETDGFMRQLVDQSFLKLFTTSAGLGLLLVPREALQTAIVFSSL